MIQIGKILILAGIIFIIEAKRADKFSSRFPPYNK